MNVELYIGLTTLGAGVFAIFAAALFVFIQTATDLFALDMPHFLLRRRLARLAVIVSFSLFAVGALASVRATFPHTDVVPGDQDIGPLVDEAWFAYLFVVVTLGSVVLNTAAVWMLVGDLRGPGMVRALVDQASNSAIKDWLDYVDPPSPEWQAPIFAELERIKNPDFDEAAAEREAKEREDRNSKLTVRLAAINKKQKEGRLANPLEPIFEVASRSTEARRYAMVDRALNAIRALVDQRLRGKAPADAARLLRLINSHMGDLLEVAIHSGSYSQVAVMIRTAEGIALDSQARTSHASYPYRISEELMLYAKRMESTEFSPLVTDIIHSIFRITITSLEKEDFDTFEHCMLQLGRIAEVLASRYRPEVGVHILAQNLSTRREQKPEDALLEGMDQLIRAFTDNEKQIPCNVVLTIDAIEISARAFLSASHFGEEAAHYAANYIGLIGHLALTAAKIHNGDALMVAVGRLQSLCDAPKIFDVEAPGYVLASTMFETGLVAQMNADQIKFDNFPEESDKILDRIAKVVACAPREVIQEAVTNYYLRGHTMYVPDAVQTEFKARIDKETGTTFKARDGRT